MSANRRSRYNQHGNAIMATSSSAPGVPLALAATPLTKKMERRVLNFVCQRDALREGERVLVAVSGGPDSTALLLILARLRAKLGLDLTIAHFNHMLRSGDEAAADLDFVLSLASQLNVPLVHGVGDVRGRAHRNHESLEDAARRLRYDFLAEQAALAGASCVLTGHTLDDQAETVLLHLVRGSGLDGLVGMRPRSSWPFREGPDLARPLLHLSREETERYCAETAVRPREDPTNLLLSATRNKIRYRILPELRELNPRIAEALSRLSQSVAEDADYLDGLARHYFGDWMAFTGDAVRGYRRHLTTVGPAMRNRWIRLAVERLAGTHADIEAIHIDAVREIATKGKGTVALPHGLQATSNSRSVVFSRREYWKALRIAETPLKVPGVTQVGKWNIATQLAPLPEDPLFPPRWAEAYLDAAKTGRDLTVRSRRPGDRLRPLGLGGEKKLQDILVDAKVPATERDGVPLACSGEQIVWVVGHCIDERYALDLGSQQALHIAAAHR